MRVFLDHFRSLSKKYFAGLVKIAFYVSRETVWWKMKFQKQMKFFIISGQWAEKFQALISFFGGDVRTAFYVSIGTL